jgi:hypothetical protein
LEVSVRLRSLIVTTAIAMGGLAANPAVAQPAFEVGAHFTSTRLSGISVNDSGIGGRFAWHLNDVWALEAVGDVYPSGSADVVRGGRKFHALFGPRAGWRAARFGIFGTTRAGVARIGEGRGAGGPCILIFPPPEGCYVGETRLAFDLGGAFEFYPSERSILRVDVSTIFTRLGRSSVRFARGDDFAHDLHIGAGVGWRF